jgi:hypothetical protein
VRLQAFAGAALYLYLPENILQTPAISCQIAAFLCCSCFDLLGLVMAVSVASNVFVITNLTFTCRNKNNAPL